MSRVDKVRWTRTRLLGSELRLIFTRIRNIALLAGLAAIPVLIGLAVYFFGDSEPEEHAGGILDQVLRNGLSLPLAAMFVALPVFLPLAVAVVGGDAIAGEAQLGTLRYLLQVPVRRTRLLAVKAAATGIFVVAAVMVIMVAGLACGALLFGFRDMVLLSGDTVPIGDALVRIVIAGAYVALSLTGLLAVGLFVSTLTDVPLAAMATTVVVAVTSTILDQLPQLDVIHPGLLTHYWMDFTEVLRLQLDPTAFVPGLLVQVAWVAVFGSLAWARFTTRNITC